MSHVNKICRLSQPCRIALIHWSRVMRIYIIKMGHHWLKWWLVSWSVPSHYLNQYCNIINRTLGNKFSWNLKGDSYIFIQENVFERIIRKWLAILFQPQGVKLYNLLDLFYAVVYQDNCSCLDDLANIRNKECRGMHVARDIYNTIINHYLIETSAVIYYMILYH